MQRFYALRVIRHRQSCGQSTALRAGVKAATHPRIATLDGDGQNDHADIPRLYRALLDRLWAGITDLLGVIWLQKRAKLLEVEIERG